MGACATNNLLELRTFAENLGDNITLSLETDTTGAKVLINELEGRNRDGTKRYKRSEYMSWYSALKRFTVLGPTAFARHEREAQRDKSTLCEVPGDGSNQKGLLINLPDICTMTRQEREARCDKPTRCEGSREGLNQKGLSVNLSDISTIKNKKGKPERVSRHSVQDVEKDRNNHAYCL
ncbi:hypothetical protein RDI58_012754 [Solanum bulbocastanum]|uniref:Uncharacterized protein n=1 Tax=Solanum bulbocastanum TaxID=147425 RepID=A0AAN8TKV4_SOLBU